MHSEKQRAYVSVLLALIALVCVSAATVAWFTIADFTKVHSMGMEVTAGTNLRFDLDPHETFEEYVKTLQFQTIAERIKQEKGFDMKKVPLDPVTTENYVDYTFEDGTLVKNDSGSYLEFTLHFMATDDMLIHLTSLNSDGQMNGTAITSSNSKVPKAMRISFTVGKKIYVFDSGLGDDMKNQGNVKIFGLPESEKMILSEKNALFDLKKNENQPVIVRIWLEGTDPACTDEIRDADYKIRLRFVGTDQDNQILDGARKE